MVLLGEIELCTARLAEAIRAGCGYIGLLGSKKKIALIFEGLRKMGISDEAVSAIHAPIGLEIGAVTPEELAVSIATEYIQHSKSASAE